MNPPSLCFRSSLIVAALSLLVIPFAATGQSTNRQIGTQFEVTADPVIPRPHGQPCKVQLFTGYTFAFFSDTTQTFPFAPPSSCTGPWKKSGIVTKIQEKRGGPVPRPARTFS